MLVLVLAFNPDRYFLNRLTQVLSYVDAIELRLDLWDIIDLTQIRILLKALVIPVIFTVRNKEQGGRYANSEYERLKLIRELASLNPQYFDLEYNVSEDFIHFLSAKYPDIKLIGSYHNFVDTPQNLEQILSRLQNKKFDIFKIATYANSTLDALRMLTFVQIKSSKTNLVGICMGELGMPTRILGKIIGNAITYTVLDDKYKSAPGQITLNTLISRYNYPYLNSNTDIYALLGDPVTHSIGDVFHNYAFRALKKNAVYVKLKIPTYEIEDAFQYFKQLPFKGFSVTMPLKELGYNLVDSIDVDSAKIKAINSIIVKDKYYGFNTDGKAAIVTLSQISHLKNKKVIILGAGGAAKAIAYQLSKFKVDLIIINRTLQKAEQIVQAFNGKAYDMVDVLQVIKQIPYDIIINTIPELAYVQSPLFYLNSIESGSLALDINYQVGSETLFIQKAKNCGCNYITGFDVYFYQAVMQLSHWFKIDVDDLKNILTDFNKVFITP
jgi:3-dehydroquinate dehydratase/shikimate dehydrogenase